MGKRRLSQEKRQGLVFQQNYSCAKSGDSKVYSGNCQWFSGIWAWVKGGDGARWATHLVCLRLSEF